VVDRVLGPNHGHRSTRQFDVLVVRRQRSDTPLAGCASQVPLAARAVPGSLPFAADETRKPDAGCDPAYRDGVESGATVVVGGTSGIGLRLAETYASRGDEVVITGRDHGRCSAAAASIAPAGVQACAFDLAAPELIAPALGAIGPVRRLVLGAVERDENSVASYDLVRALRLVTLKLVGYTEVIHALAPRFTRDASILLFGGLAMRRPYPGSTTVSTVNGGITGLVHTLAVELAPIRVNALHPGIVGDSPYWADKPPAVLEAVRARTPLGRLVAMDEIVGAAMFLLDNGAVNGINLDVDGGWLLT
jgi:NAD(P)-dependent dehydrogenase (short-subunit alcohol dehydrogenase family)